MSATTRPTAQAAQPKQTMWQEFIGMAPRVLLVYFIMQFVSKQFLTQPPVPLPNTGPPTPPPVNNMGDADDDGNDIISPNLGLGSKFANNRGGGGGIPLQTNLISSWKLNDPTVLTVYLSPKENFHPRKETPFIMQERDIAFGDFKDPRMLGPLSIPCTEAMQNNGSLYAHIYLSKDDVWPWEWDSSSSNTIGGRKEEFPGKGKRTFSQGSHFLMYERKLLTRYQLEKKIVTKRKLVRGGGGSSSSEEEELEVEVEVGEEGGESPVAVKKERKIVSYWFNNLTINAVSMQDSIPSMQPPKVLEYLQTDKETGSFYFPFFGSNDFWMLQDDLLPITSKNTTLNLTISYHPIEFWKFQAYKQMEESFRIQVDVMGQNEGESDQMKRLFLDTNPILLGVTMFVSLLHSFFDFLAFKNDIAFWKNKKDMEGISFRSIIVNVIFQVIILLYLFDNDTSTMILVSSSIGLLIEVWKINKTVIVKQIPVFPFLTFIDRMKPSKLTKKTRKYDQLAFSYLSYALFPLMVAYTVYSLQYEEHKSWYSFVIGTLVGFVYTFGFISMTPQLFINYKLKSVAHMPWKTFIYKALNTFIDDLFAFVIKMPWLHRLACLRDDAVFLVYLYQKWIYPEDKRRRNEFGQVGDEITGENDDEFDSDDEKEDVVKVKGVGSAVEGEKAGGAVKRTGKGREEETPKNKKESKK